MKAVGLLKFVGLVTLASLGVLLALLAWGTVMKGLVRRAVREALSQSPPSLSISTGHAEPENEVLAFRPLSEDAVEVTVRLSSGVTNLVFRRAP